MSKKVIRLTEADIEKIVKSVIEEQRRSGGQLIGSKKRKVPKKDNESSDWKGKNRGTLNFDSMGSDRRPASLAVNVGPEGFTIKMHNDQGKLIQPITGQDEIITLEEYNISGLSLPYADNMVKPYFDKYPDAQKVFDEIVTKFVAYINAGGGPKLTNVTIKGSADSARPTLDVPSGYSQLDHPDSKPYNGETDPYKMNQYLADKRAEEYANVLKSAIKEKTGFDLSITVLQGDNYYGQQGKRGEEYRKITLSPNAETLTVPNPSQTTTPGKRDENQNIPYYVDYYKDGQSYTAKGYRVVDPKGNSFVSISSENREKLGTPAFDGKMSSKIEGDKFYIDGRLVGTMQPKSTQPPVEFDTSGKEFSYWVGPITNYIDKKNAQIKGEGVVNVSYLKDAYFLFY